MYADRTAGVTVLGKTRSGKTTLLEHLIREDLRAGTAAVIIDADGDLTRRIISLAPKGSESRLILLEPWKDRPFRLNVLECPSQDIDRTTKSVVALFKKLFGTSREYSPRLERDLQLIARTLIPNNGTLLDAMRLFDDTALRQNYLGNVRNRMVHEFWAWYDKGSQRDRAAQIEAVINRLADFLLSEFIQEVVGSHHTSIPFDEVLHGSAVLILNIGPEHQQPDQATFLGALFLCVLTERIFDRGPLGEATGRVHLYLDEYQRFATSTTAELLTRAGKYNVGVTLAHQTRTQLDEENKEAELQTGTLICTTLTPSDAEDVAPAFPVKPEPQRIERVEEIEGLEPVLAIPLSPVAHLLEHGHENADVRRATRALALVKKFQGIYEENVRVFRRRLEEITRIHNPNQWVGSFQMQKDVDVLKIQIDDAQTRGQFLGQALSSVDRLLERLMRREYEPDARVTYLEIVAILKQLQPLLQVIARGCWPGSPWYDGWPQ